MPPLTPSSSSSGQTGVGQIQARRQVTFQYVQPTEEMIAQMQNFRDKYEALYREIESSVIFGRGKSTALTKLEESAMWLNKGITQND